MFKNKTETEISSNANLDPGVSGLVAWSSEDLTESVKQLLAYVEAEANKAITWYWRSKRWKARCSRVIQLAAIGLTALAGIFPVVAYLLKELKWPYPSESGLWSSLYVGVAAALIGVDRAFGLSSGWTRYVLTATSIRKRLEEFRLDCALLMCKPAQNDPDQMVRVIQLAKEFRLAVEDAVYQETKEWATEFQNNVAQLEKDAKAQLDALRGEIEKSRKLQAPGETGALELTIANAQTAENGGAAVSLEGVSGPVANELLTGTDKWVRIGLAPGQYKLSVKATVSGRAFSTVGAVLVKSGELARVDMSLPNGTAGSTK